MKSISFETRTTSEGSSYTKVIAVCEFNQHTRIEIDMNADKRSIAGKSIVGAQAFVLDKAIEELRQLRQTYEPFLDREKRLAETPSNTSPGD